MSNINELLQGFQRFQVKSFEPNREAGMPHFRAFNRYRYLMVPKTVE
ncbi:hypothetical protein BN874_30052 [Candidatus Contendobacter odensis Run_B_J11]|uniref:Uncharacterized protein n=1 Tax=Candidatus Contendobacter odensis Run_B_J11 TaxID=1400861 RepID=A0A7U7J4R3_9GAMM|nr:hypothetical protein BN874_30052 [Candidatus Contendobacter odensis Run_B_J11]